MKFSSMSICQQDAQGVQSVHAQSWVVSFADVLLAVIEVILIQVFLVPIYLVERISVSSSPSELVPYKFSTFFLSSPCNGITPNSSQITHLDIYLKHTCELAWVIKENLRNESEELFDKQKSVLISNPTFRFNTKKASTLFK